MAATYNAPRGRRPAVRTYGAGKTRRTAKKGGSLLPLLLIAAGTILVVVAVVFIVRCSSGDPDNAVPVSAVAVTPTPALVSLQTEAPAPASVTSGDATVDDTTAGGAAVDDTTANGAAVDDTAADGVTVDDTTAGGTTVDDTTAGGATVDAAYVGENLGDDAYAGDEVVSVRPTAAPGGYLPIFSKAKTEEKIIAITVDDCNQTENLQRIVQCAVDNSSLLTIFPIGKNLAREGLQKVIREAYAQGMELENHSFSHSTFYRLSAGEMAAEIYNANRAVSAVLGVNYQMHFMRTRGGDNRRDLRTHRYIEKLGYYGMAHWTMSGSSTGIDKLKATLEPGNIYLFHTTDQDLEKLLAFIPYAVAQGYTPVTLNRMFGYPDNEVSEITTPLKALTVPEPDPYVYEYKTLSPKKFNYTWDVYLVQARLIELGWLGGEADGVYGKGTFMAVGYFQRAVGQKPTGEATPEMQEVLFSDDAPRTRDGTTPIGGTQTAATQAPDGPVATTTPRITTAADVDLTLFD